MKKYRLPRKLKKKFKKELLQWIKTYYPYPNKCIHGFKTQNNHCIECPFENNCLVKPNTDKKSPQGKQ